MGIDDEIAPISIAHAEHCAWGDSCDGWPLHRSATLSVIAERMPPDAAEVAHRHARSQQFFNVLRGELAIECERHRHVLRKHEGPHIPPSVPHRPRNVSSGAVDFLVISEPASHDDGEIVPLGAREGDAFDLTEGRR